MPQRDRRRWPIRRNHLDLVGRSFPKWDTDEPPTPVRPTRAGGRAPEPWQLPEEGTQIQRLVEVERQQLQRDELLLEILASGLQVGLEDLVEDALGLVGVGVDLLGVGGDGAAGRCDTRAVPDGEVLEAADGALRDRCIFPR